MPSPVRTVVTFKSKQFNITEPKDYFINPGCFGDDLCMWMISQLRDMEIECDEKPGQEDFGWYFDFSKDMVKYCLVCGFRAEDDGEDGTWVAWVERSAGFLSSLFGGRDRGIEAGGPNTIHQILVASPEVSQIRWHHKKDFERGDEAGADGPG